MGKKTLEFDASYFSGSRWFAAAASRVADWQSPSKNFRLVRISCRYTITSIVSISDIFIY